MLDHCWQQTTTQTNKYIKKSRQNADSTNDDNEGKTPILLTPFSVTLKGPLSHKASQPGTIEEDEEESRDCIVMNRIH